MKKIQFIASFFTVLSALNLTAQTITEVGSWTNNPNFSVQYLADRLYVGAVTNSANILNVSTTGNPTYVDDLNFSTDFPMAFEISSNLCYVGGSGFFGGNAMFAVVDVTNPDLPVVLSESTMFQGVVTEIKIKGNIAFVVTGAPKLYAVDISTPTSPFIIGTLDLGTIGTDGANGLVLSEDGTKAFVGTSSGTFGASLGIRTISISNPSAMSILSTSSGNYTYLTYDNIDDRLFASRYDGGFDAFTVSSSGILVPLFEVHDTPNYTKRLIYKNNQLFYITSGQLRVYTVTANIPILVFEHLFDNQVVDFDIKDISTIYVSSVNAVTEFAIDWNGQAGLIDKNLKLSEVYIFPNPCKNKLTIENIRQNSTVKLSNYLGQEIQEIERSFNFQTQIELDLNSVSEGSYLLQIESEGEIQVFPIIVAR